MIKFKKILKETKGIYMGFRYLIGTAIIIFLIAVYIIGGAEDISKFIEEYSEKKYKEPTIEKIAYYNIHYCYFVGKYKRAIELIDKFLDKYKDSALVEKIYYLKAKTYDRMVFSSKAKNWYNMYIERFPDGKYVKNAKKRLRELLLSKF